MYNFTGKEIENAYLILKKSIYYENNVLLYLKKQIAEFEFDKKLKDKNCRNKFFTNLANRINSGDLFEDLIKEISYKKVIKKWEDKISENLYSENDIEALFQEKETIKKEDIKSLFKNDDEKKIVYNYAIECDISLHIISILWIQKEGVKLDEEVKKYSYGYRLNLDKERNIKNSTLFKKYIEQYHLWKKNGISKAREIINDDENAVLLNLDLKKFYYNISQSRLYEKIKLIDKDICESPLSKIIFKINKEYAFLVATDSPLEKKEMILPIGLYSSSILANFYLKELDNKILDLSPIYYGRYVDDLFIVFKEYNNENLQDKKSYLDKKLKCILDDMDLGINESFNEEILYRNKKQQVIFLNNKKKKFELLKIETSFLERASTFAFLPNETEIEKLYNKISSTVDENLKEKKYDVSVYLSKILNIFSGLDKKENSIKIKSTSKDLLDFFSEDHIIRYSVYIEKIFTLLSMGELNNEIEVLYKKINKFFKDVETDKKNLEFLKEYLNNSFFFAISLNPKLLKKINLKVFEDENILKEHIYKIVDSNMFKHNMINYPLLNYLYFTREDLFSKINFFETRYFDFVKSSKEYSELQLCQEKLFLSPRFIHLDEFNIFYIKQKILKHNTDKEFNYLGESKIKFAINFGINSKEKRKSIFENYIHEDNYDGLKFLKIQNFDRENLNIPKIGVASLLIDHDILKVLDGKQNLSFEKKSKIVDILNQAKRNKVDILIFPEASIPFQWLKIINEFSRRNQILVTGGLEHIHCPNLEYNDSNCPKYAFNYLFTTLPFYTENYTTSTIKIRLKNFYAPEEVSIIEGKKFFIPTPSRISYDIFSWKGIYFSNFNCFELSDIIGRSQLKNKIDLLIASVFNKDLVYFQNILESTSRDLHIFVAQSNTSIYGNCEILQPTKKDNMIIAQIKGGMNDNLLVGKIDIKSLREFQLLENSAQKNGKFKLTPPRIDANLVKSRIQNILLEELKKIKFLEG